MKRTTLYEDPSAHPYLNRRIEDLHHRMILESVLERFNLQGHDTLVELGAGSGRFTEMLLSLGFRVKAYEPDPYLCTKLRERLAGQDNLEVFNRGLGKLTASDEIRLVCGFHVLHHFDLEHLKILAVTIGEFRKQARHFQGWFFLEPNPLNILYPLSILITPGMRFREEKGLWRFSYSQLKTLQDGRPVVMGTLGFFPPRKFLARLPAGVARLGTGIKDGKSLFRLYTVIGEVG